MHYETRFCPHCATALAPIVMAEDGGDKERLRCPACGWTHWNNPTPVLAAIVELDGKVLLARNAAWPPKMFALITGFMEAGESPQEGIAREVKEIDRAICGSRARVALTMLLLPAPEGAATTNRVPGGWVPVMAGWAPGRKGVAKVSR